MHICCRYNGPTFSQGKEIYAKVLEYVSGWDTQTGSEGIATLEEGNR